MNSKKLQLGQIEVKLKAFTGAASVVAPPTGWIRAVRLALGMSLQQLANRLSITKQGVQEIEQREKGGSITVRSLRETARALDTTLVLLCHIQLFRNQSFYFKKSAWGTIESIVLSLEWYSYRSSAKLRV